MPVATVTSAPQNKEQLSMRVRVLETVILSCYLLFWILIVMRQLHSWRYFDNFGTVISEDSPEVSLEHNGKVCPDKIGSELNYKHLGSSGTCLVDTIIKEPKTENVTTENVSKIFEKYLREDSTLQSVAVYSCPLNTPFSSSKVTVKNHVQRQYSSVDYHAFVVFSSSSGVWMALDKMKDGVYVSWGGNLSAVLFNFEGESRPRPLRLLIKDDSNTTSSELIHHLKELLSSNVYNLIRQNCQHFSKKMFDKHAIGHSWDFATPSELASFLNIFNYGGLPVIISAFIVCFIMELFLLSKKSEYRPTHLKIVFVAVFMLSLAYGIILSLDLEQSNLFRDILSPTLTSCILLCAQFLESVFIFNSFGTIRRRASHYGRIMWIHDNFFFKLLLASRFTIMYSATTFVTLAYPMKFLVKYCGVSFLSFLLLGSEWLVELLLLGVNWQAIATFLIGLAVTYFILQKHFLHPMLVVPKEYQCPLPYGKGNGTSTLNDILQRNGAKHADINTIKHHETSFSAKIEFTLLDKKLEYQSDTKCKNMKEAKKNAAFVALVGLKLMTPPNKQKSRNLTHEDDRTPIQVGEESLSRINSILARNDLNSSEPISGENSKNQLQEFCQKYNHELPKYNHLEFCNNHPKFFTATVTVKLSDGNMVEKASDKFKSKKEAEFQAAERALEVCNSRMRSRNYSNDSSSSMSSMRSVLDRIWPSPAPGSSRNTVPELTPDKNFKNLLQEFCQKEGLSMPDYKTKEELNRKSKVFLSEVTIHLKSGEHVSGKSDKHSRRKNAELQAAERALNSLPPAQFPTPPIKSREPSPVQNNNDSYHSQNLIKELFPQKGYSPPTWLSKTSDVGDKCNHGRSRNNSNDSSSFMSSMRSVPDRTCSSPAPGSSRNSVPELTPDKNFKNLLQEFCQKEGLSMPYYDTTEDQKLKKFSSEVTVHLKSGEHVSGKSNKHSRRKNAELQAAERAFKSLPPAQ
ncbi:hypothetical protein ACHWQZ_G016304 [Mnemiopsis leidyi]